MYIIMYIHEQTKQLLLLKKKTRIINITSIIFHLYGWQIDKNCQESSVQLWSMKESVNETGSW